MSDISSATAFASHTSVLRLPQVLARVGLGRASVYRLMQNGAFPRPVKLGPRAVGWRAGDVETWLAEREVSA